MSHKYTAEQRSFFREDATGHSYKEIQAMFAERFGVELTEIAIKSYMTNHKLKTGTYRKYNQVHIDWLRENTQGTRFKDLTRMFNDRFGLNIGVAAMISLCDRFGLHNGIDSRFNPDMVAAGARYRFPKGNVPANKGKKGICYPGCEATQFKKGNMPVNHRQVGSERTNADGYVEIKIAEPKTWRAKHIVLWESVHGPVPSGHAVIFADRDKQNITLENLLLVSRAQLVRLNQSNLIGGSADLTRAGILVADIITKMAERRKSRKKRKEPKGHETTGHR